VSAAPTAAAAPASRPPRIPGLGRPVRLPIVGASVRVDPRSLGVCGVLVVVVLVLLVYAIGTGEYPISPGDVVKALFGAGDSGTSFVVQTLRLPRALTALLVGGALGAAGAIFQSITRNPLGSPDIIGFEAGASAAAVAAILLFSSQTGTIALCAIAGGLLTALAVYLLAYRGGVQGYRLVLVGIGMSSMLYALTDWLLTRARLDDAMSAYVWLTGSLNGRGWEHVRPLALAMVLLLPIVALLSRPLRMMELGDDAAKALGVQVERSRLALVLVGVCLTAAAVASAGPIAFVALASPQIARRLTHATGPGLPAAMLTGAALLLASDLIAQRLFTATELPVGVVTGVLGGVYLMWLLFHEWRKGQT
jgi:iron complex transport system permease protein